MPVEIREMVIKVAVDEAAGKKGTTGGSTEQQEGSPDAIVRACVEKVLQILKDQRER